MPPSLQLNTHNPHCPVTLGQAVLVALKDAFKGAPHPYNRSRQDGDLCESAPNLHIRHCKYCALTLPLNEFTIFSLFDLTQSPQHNNSRMSTEVETSCTCMQQKLLVLLCQATHICLCNSCRLSAQALLVRSKCNTCVHLCTALAKGQCSVLPLKSHCKASVKQTILSSVGGLTVGCNICFT